MRNLKRVSLVSLVSVALLGTMALPATAADDGGTTVTVEVEAGQLTIDVTPPVEGFKLSAAVPLVENGVVAARTAQATLPNIQVTDLRGDYTAGWTSSVEISDLDLLGTDDIVVTAGAIEAANVSFVMAPETGWGSGADLTALPEGVGVIAVPTAAVSTGSFSTAVTVAIPSEAPAGKYSGTLTHSVS